jgi:hypothetical protein
MSGMNGPTISVTTRSHVAHCSAHAGMRLRRGRGNVCSYELVVIAVLARNER